MNLSDECSTIHPYGTNYRKYIPHSISSSAVLVKHIAENCSVPRKARPLFGLIYFTITEVEMEYSSSGYMPIMRRFVALLAVQSAPSTFYGSA